MGNLENNIKAFVKSKGVDLVGVAGPDQLDGPPSTDVTFSMGGAKSIVSMAVPMNVDYIYDFLSKKSQASHNFDQFYWNQKLHHIGVEVADYIESLGYKAKALPTNSDYRRSPDIFANHPSFSHRFGAIAAGLGTFGLSGNVMTKEYGAAIYLDTVVTSAELESDPMMDPGYFMDNYCIKCRACDKSCVARMFTGDDEEYVLFNSKLYPRGFRRDINFCNASCFGLHSLSEDKTWSSWGKHWIKHWIDELPDPKKTSIRKQLNLKGGSVGDSTARYKAIRYTSRPLMPKEWLEEKYLKDPSLLPEDKEEQNKLFSELIQKYVGVKIELPVLTCGQCSLVCGPTIQESQKRLKMLRESGLVVPGKDGKSLVTVNTFEEARDMRIEYSLKVPLWKKIFDSIHSLFLWTRLYFGINPKTIIQNCIYQRKMQKAINEMKRVDRAPVKIEKGDVSDAREVEPV